MGSGLVNDVAYAVTAFLMLIGMGYKLVRAGRSSIGRRVSYALVCCIFFLGVAVALQISAFRRWIDAFGNQQSAVLVAEALAMAALCSYQIAMVLINNPNESEYRGVCSRFTLGTVSILVVALLGSLSSSPTYPGMVPPQRDPFGFAMETVFVLYVAYVSADVARLAIRFARLGGDRNLLRLSMYGMALNAFVSIAYAAAKLVFLAMLTIVGTSVLEVQYAVTLPLVVTTALLVVVFATLPSWGRLVGGDRAAAWFGRYMSFLALYPLWEAIATDKLTLQRRSRWSDRLILRDIDFRLTRRIIEIHDGLLALAPYRDRGIYLTAIDIGQARGLKGVELEAAAEAASIAVATVDRRSGRSREAQREEQQIKEIHGRSETKVAIVDEVIWLAQLTDAYQRSAVVRAVQRQFT